MELTEAVSSAPELRSVLLAIDKDCEKTSLDDISKESIKPLKERDEKYQLQISESGATITACSALGLLRGLTTFEQLVYVLPQQSTSKSRSKEKDCSTDTPNSGVRFIQNTPISINDQPAFPWRGLLLDTARNYFSTSTIKKTILTASYAKLSVFYWHVTDSQSFPLQLSGTLANITAQGAYDTNSIYTPDQVQEIIAYANRLGIDVVFEGMYCFILYVLGTEH